MSRDGHRSGTLHECLARGAWSARRARCPSELGNLASMERLDLGSNTLTGGVPPAVGCPRQLGAANLGAQRRDVWDVACGMDIAGDVGASARRQGLCAPSDPAFGSWLKSILFLSNLRDLFWGGNADLCAPGTRQFIDFAAALDRTFGPFCHEADTAALEALYSSAGGSSWGSSDGWLLPGPLSDWHGVDTDSVAGRVVALDLSGNDLSGVLPASLTSMGAMKELRIDSNSALGGRLPHGMIGLSLRTLRLRWHERVRPGRSFVSQVVAVDNVAHG